MDLTGIISIWEGENALNLGVDSVVASANDLANNGGVTQGTGVVGSSMNFVAASTQTLSKASNASLQVGGAVSFGAWVKLTSLATFGLLGKWQGATIEYLLAYAHGYGWVVNVRDSGDTTTYGAIHASGVASTGVWYFVTGGFMPSVPRIWVNVNAGTRTNVAGPAAIRSSTALFALGTFSVGQYLNGDLDQVIIQKAEWSGADETYLYNAGAGRTAAEILASDSVLGGGSAYVDVSNFSYSKRVQVIEY